MSASEGSIPAHVPPDRVFPFDFRQDPRIARDPWSFFHSANELPEIFYSPDLGGHWVIARAELLEEAWSRPELFSAESVSVPKIESPFRLIPNNLDPPEHRPFSLIFNREMFAPRILDGMVDEIRAMTRERIAAFRDRGRCDFNAEIAHVLPVEIFLRMFGVPAARRPEFDTPCDLVFRSRTAEGTFQGMVQVAGLLSDWLDEELRDRSAPREAHLLEAMLAARVEGRLLTKEELLSMATMLMLAGLDTVTSAIQHQIVFLATHPEHRQQLLDDPSLIPNAVEEMLRRFGVANVGRMVRHDEVFHGVALRAGEMVLFSTSIAGLDEQRFPDAMRVDFQRENVTADSLAFGTGVHLCSGQGLARRELRIALEELLPALPELRLAPEAKLEYVSGGTVSVRSELPIVWDT